MNLFVFGLGFSARHFAERERARFGAVRATVTEPERATPAPVGAREDAMRSLLQTAADAGITRVAPRPQGDQERLLGQAWPFPSPF